MVLQIVLPESPSDGNRVQQQQQQQHLQRHPSSNDDQRHGSKVFYCNKKLWLTRPTTGLNDPPIIKLEGVGHSCYNLGPHRPEEFNAQPFFVKVAAGCQKFPGSYAPTDNNVKRGRENLAHVHVSPITITEKKALFRGYLTIILSCIYAIFVLMLGVVVYIADLISRTAILAEVFSVYLVALGLSWLIFLYFDIRRHQYRIRNCFLEERENRQNLGFPPSSKPVRATNGSDNRNYSESNRTSQEGHQASPNNNSSGKHGTSSSSSNENSSSNPPLRFKLTSFTNFNRHAYIFCHSRHSGSFYLKIGAAGFCFGHLIHSGLLLCRQIIFFTSDDERVYSRCANLANLVLDVLFPIYSFLLLFVIFKYSNVIINRHKELSRFALMHCISSSLCFWFWSILRETADSLYHKMAEGNNASFYGQKFTRNNHHQAHPLFHQHSSALRGFTPSPSNAHGLDRENQVPRPQSLTAFDSDSQSSVFDFLNASSAITTFYDPCVEESSISELVVKMSPYLYPFSIEYSILIVGVLFIMWQNIGKGQDIMRHRRRRPSSQEGQEGGGSDPRYPPQPFHTHAQYNPHHYNHHQHHPSSIASFTNHLVIHADCHAANKGLFAGLLILVGTVISVIIFYIALDDFRSGFAAQWVNLTSQAVLLVIMIITVLCAYRQITRLDINVHAVSLLDDLLLFLCLPSFFLYTIFTVVPAMAHQDFYAIVVCSLQVIQVILQTPCIIDGLRRCSNSEELRRKKPGRELITFLIVCNLAMWIIETFEIKSVYAQHEQISFYGSILWTLLSHMTLPLTLFYRFHSSVCLVDIWKSAYESNV